ncbi:MAG: hypothetical protein ACMVY4_17205 [Minwuia sp.]|uniref:hypothetical protein n=1 Tax=Minwuia sp. TaxID=2493630 RepID=UPI003A8372FF
MIVVRIIGYLILLAGLVALGAEIYASLEAGSWTPISLGKRWFELFGAESILAIQNGLQRYVHPFLWDPLVQSVFEAPAWLPLVVLGLIIVVLARRRRQKRMFS